MSDPFDPFNPNTSLGQTAWGSLVRSQKQLGEDMAARVADSAALVRRLQGANAGQPLHPGVPAAQPIDPEVARYNELYRRSRARFAKRRGLISWLLLRSYSFFNDDGSIRADDAGFLIDGELVTCTAAHERFRRAYRYWWNYCLEHPDRFSHSMSAGKQRRVPDAYTKMCEERLLLLTKNKVIIPTDRNGRYPVRNYYRENGQKNRRRRVYVGTAYRAFNKFLSRHMYGYDHRYAFRADDWGRRGANKQWGTLKPDQAIIWFILSPSSLSDLTLNFSCSDRSDRQTSR